MNGAGIAVFRKGKSSFRIAGGSSHLVYPDLVENKVEGDYELEMLMLDGTWQARRVRWTSDIIQFARVDESRVVDCIPMHEISCVIEMQDAGSASPWASVERFTRSKSAANAADHSIESDSGFETAGDQDNVHEPNKRSTDSVTQKFLLRKAVKGQVNTLQIMTIPDGYNSGRTYYIRAKSENLCRKMTLDLNKLSTAAKERAVVKSRFQTVQLRVRRVYNSTSFQMFTALLIILVCMPYFFVVCFQSESFCFTQNFFVNATESQLSDLLTNDDGSLTAVGEDLEKLDEFFTIIFAAELALNAFAHWFKPFISDGWNIFDLIVVLMSLVALGPVKIPVNVIRSLRAFRVIRLFGRLKGLKNIVMALASSVIPVLQALLILLIVGSIYAILGTTIFGNDAPNDFGRFDQAVVTLFRVTAGMGWIEQVLPIKSIDGSVNWKVCVAILLDNFITANTVSQQEREAELISQAMKRKLFLNALDPLLEKLSVDHNDDADLSERLQELFKDFKPRIHISESDYAVLTKGGSLCDEQGNLGPMQFEAALRNQMKLYIQRQLSNALILGASSRTELVQLGTLKAVLREQAKLHEDQAAWRGTTQEATSVQLEALNHVMVELQRDMRELVGYIRGVGDVCTSESHRNQVLFSRQLHELPSLIDLKFEGEAGATKEGACVVSLSPRSYAGYSFKSQNVVPFVDSPMVNFSGAYIPDGSLQATQKHGVEQVQQGLCPHTSIGLISALVMDTDDGAGIRSHNSDPLIERCQPSKNDTSGENSTRSESMKSNLVSLRNHDPGVSQLNITLQDNQGNKMVIAQEISKNMHSTQDAVDGFNNVNGTTHCSGDVSCCQTPSSNKDGSKQSSHSGSFTPEYRNEMDFRAGREEPASPRIPKVFSHHFGTIGDELMDSRRFSSETDILLPDQTGIAETEINVPEFSRIHPHLDQPSQLHKDYSGMGNQINSLEEKNLLSKVESKFESKAKVVKSAAEIKWSRRISSQMLPVDAEVACSPDTLKCSPTMPTNVKIHTGKAATDLQELTKCAVETTVGDNHAEKMHSTLPNVLKKNETVVSGVKSSQNSPDCRIS